MINWAVIVAPAFYLIYIILQEKNLIFLKLLFLKYLYLCKYK